MPDRTRNAQRSAVPAQERAGRLDWGNLRFFLELSRTGSLSRAAQRLAVDRNTVARRVAALEEELGLPLFERGPQGWTRTAAGDDLAALASRVEEDVLAIARHADARDPALSGTVRLTTATHLAAFLLAPALPRLRERHPGLVLEIAANQRTFDLTRREADLALRFGRPRDAGLVTRKLSEVAYGLYAGTGYAGGSRRSAGSRASRRRGASCSGRTARPRSRPRRGRVSASRCCLASWPGGTRPSSGSKARSR